MWLLFEFYLSTDIDNINTNRNFIPLFYYDKANKKVLVLEPTIYEIKSFDKAKISEITKELKES